MMNGRNPAAKAIADWIEIIFTLVGIIHKTFQDHASKADVLFTD